MECTELTRNTWSGLSIYHRKHPRKAKLIMVSGKAGDGDSYLGFFLEEHMMLPRFYSMKSSSREYILKIAYMPTLVIFFMITISIFNRFYISLCFWSCTCTRMHFHQYQHSNFIPLRTRNSKLVIHFVEAVVAYLSLFVWIFVLFLTKSRERLVRSDKEWLHVTCKEEYGNSRGIGWWW